jgi:hypothetical protein
MAFFVADGEGGNNGGVIAEVLELSEDGINGDSGEIRSCKTGALVCVSCDAMSLVGFLDLGLRCFG